MSSKKKPAQEARERLREKVDDARIKSEKLHALINNIVEHPIARAEEVLKEKSKTKFLAKYSKVSTEVEECLNQLLLVTDAIASLEDSDDEESGEDGDGDDEDESDSTLSVHTNATNATNVTNVTVEGFDLHGTQYESHESLTSISTSISTHDTFHRSVSENENNNNVQGTSVATRDTFHHDTIHRSVSQNENNVQNDVSLPVNDNLPVNPIPVHNEVLTNNISIYEDKQPTLPLSDGTLNQNEVITKGGESFPVLTDVIVESFQWDLDVPYPVVILNTYTPMNFYVQIINPDIDIMEQLFMYFLEEASNGYYGGINYIPSPNTFCCAKSSSNGPWYRAKIIDNQPKDKFGSFIKDEVCVKVFFVDEGYEDIVKLLYIRPLHQQFATLPAQSLKCILGGVQPIEAAAQTKTLSFSECDKMWLPPSISFFENLAKNGSICTSYFYSPPKSSYEPPHNVSCDTVVCDLYIVSAGTKVAWWKTSTNRLPIEDHIAFKMIISNMAAHCSFFYSEVSSKNSMNIVQQYMTPKPTDVVTENCIVKKDNTKEENKETVEEECVPLPSSQRKVFQRAQSEEREKIDVKDEKMSKSFDENMNLNDSSGNVLHDMRPRRLSPVHKNIIPEKEVSERRNHVMQNDPRWPADEKPAYKKNEKFFPIKETSDNNPVLETSDVKKEEAISTKPTKSPSPIKYCKFGTSFMETILTPEPASGFAKVLVSEVINPCLFYVHLVTEEVVLLDKLMTELNLFYNDKANEIRKYSNEEGYKYEIGNAVAVFVDKMWYRACILSTRSTNNGKQEYEVLFVDFGSGEWISEEYVLPIIEQFCNLPMEIIACSLADIKPCSNVVTKQVKGVNICPNGFESPDSDNSQNDAGNMKWPQQAIERTKELILTQTPLMVSLKTAFKNSNGLYEVHVFDTADDRDVFINQLLVDEGLASSDVLTKKVAPSVKISEVQLEEKIAEDNAMSSWDPMTEQYLSNRNVYSVDVDDAGVASLGYVQPKKNLCNNFFHRGYCYRGDNCKFVHALPGDPLYDTVEVFCDDTILDLPKPERCVPVVIRALLDPTHFWVNFPYGIDWDDDKEEKNDNCGEESLEKLHLNMNLYYSKLGHSRKTNLSILAEGELIAAKFHEDDHWYRARVINTAEDLVQVFYVDYGNTDVIAEDHTNVLLPDFLHLPFQAVECFLFNTYLEEEVMPQDDKFVNMRIRFRDMVADKVLMAYVVSSSITKSIVVMLYDTTTEPHTYINDQVRGWDGIMPKDVNDIDMLKDRLMQGKNNATKQKISYIPG